MLFPFRLMGLLLLVLLIPGSVQMWQMPTMAKQNEHELALVTMRALEQDKPTVPFTLLGYRETTQPAVIDLCAYQSSTYHTVLMVFSANFYNLRAVSTSSERLPDGRYRYRVTYNHRDPRVVEATTPHLKVAQADLAEAREALDRLFEDRKQRREMLEWGESLFWTEWLWQSSLSSVPTKAIPAPLGGTEEERLWLVWQVLRGSSAEAKEELFRLPELFEEAFPKAEDRAAALKWAEGLYDRLEADFIAYRTGVRAHLAEVAKQKGPRVEAWEDNNPYEPIHAGFERVLPPKTEWTHLWLVYRYAGLTRPSRAAARAHWLSCFPKKSEEEVLKLGAKIEEERRAAGEPLPNVPETLPLVCLCERLVGSDPYGQRCREAIKHTHGSDLSRLRFSILSAYPNDEIYYLLASPDSLGLFPIGSGKKALSDRLERLSGSTLFPLIASLGFCTLLYWIAVPLLMPRRSRPLWKKHQEGRGKEPIWLWASSVVVFAAIGALVAPLTLPDVIAVQMDSYGALFLGSLAATAVGGVLIGTFRRLLAVVLIACGVDVEATWIDEALGILIGAFVLYHFGNDLLPITLFVLSDLAPGVVEALLHRRHHTAPAATAALQGAGA